ncbi:MAG: hypothetical protein OIF57_03315 [Marinobacterium sp.]|nr:hypothetical protein [Marinobacterium sp.]
MKRLLIFFSVMTITGCSSKGLSAQDLAQLQQARPNTLTVTCPAGGCTVEYRDPRDQIQLPRQTNAYDVAQQLIQTGGSVAMGVAPWVATASIAADSFKKAGNVITDSYNADNTHTPAVITTPDPVVVTAPDPLVVHPVVVQPQPLQAVSP